MTAKQAPDQRKQVDLARVACVTRRKRVWARERRFWWSVGGRYSCRRGQHINTTAAPTALQRQAQTSSLFNQRKVKFS